MCMAKGYSSPSKSVRVGTPTELKINTELRRTLRVNIASSFLPSAPTASVPSESSNTTVNSRPHSSMYFSGTTHIQIPIVSGSNEWPRGKTSPWSNALLRMYDLPLRHGPAIDTTQTGPWMALSLRSAAFTSWSPVRGWLSSRWKFADVSSQVQLFGIHNGMAAMLFLDLLSGGLFEKVTICFLIGHPQSRRAWHSINRTVLVT